VIAALAALGGALLVYTGLAMAWRRLLATFVAPGGRDLSVPVPAKSARETSDVLL